MVILCVKFKTSPDCDYGEICNFKKCDGCYEYHHDREHTYADCIIYKILESIPELKNKVKKD